VVPAKQRVATLMVRGRVLRAEDGEPIAAARVQLIPLGAADWSNADGRFAIGPVPEGDYSLHVEAAGFEDAVLSGLSVAAEMGEPEVRLSPDHEQLSEVVVSTSRYAVDRAGALGALNIDGDTLAFQPVIGEDALRALGCPASRRMA
jgi:Carboxypeptidase regulatory-like domain